MKNTILKIIMALTFSMLIATVCSANSGFEKTKEYQNNFTDVEASQWYAEGIKTVYEYGLMDGVKADTFDTEGEVTVAQGITIAARLKSVYDGKDIPEAGADSKNWYDKYVLYAIDNKIINKDNFKDFNRTLKSYEMVEIFANALPETVFPAINNITNILDVAEDNTYFKNVTLFYNAGILNGNDKYGSFYPTSTLTRKRMAVILSRIVDESQRVKFTLPAEKPEFTLQELYDIINLITSPMPLDAISIMKVGKDDISVSNYRKYYMYLATSYSGEELKNATLDNILFYESVKQIIRENNITFPYEYMRYFLSMYYEYKISYGENYNTYLSLLNSTDRVLCEQELLYTLYSYTLNKLFGYGGAMAATDEEVMKYILTNDYIHAKHILILNETENAAQLANEIYVKVANSENFDELVEKYGQDPGMKASPDGYYFTKGEMVKEFEEAAYALQNGQTSGIVKTEYGYHIIKREAIDVEAFKKSNSFSNAFGNCSGQKGNDYIISKSKELNVEYVENFDNILSIFG